MPIYGDIIETDTIEAMERLEARNHVSEVTLLPNANLGADGLLRGVVVDVEGGISPQLIGNHASRSYVAVKTELEGADSLVNADIARMILSNIMPDNCRLVEIGVDNCDCVWILSVFDNGLVNVGTNLKVLTRLQEIRKYVTSFNPYFFGDRDFVIDVIESLFGDYEYTDMITVLPNRLHRIGGVKKHCRNASILTDNYKRGIILGSQQAGFAIVEGEGYYPTSCGTHLNKELAKGIMDKQVHDIEYEGVTTNASYFESPSRYRNLDNIVDSLPDIQIVKRIRPILSVKNGDM